jgi:predicted transcriptional regulator of viral defense system/very-short-patch-repair endonuclease
MEDKGRTERRPLALAALATRQHGIVSAGQLRALGYSTTAVSKAAARGRLHRIHRRVYAVGHRDLTWEGRCLAAVLACAPALASHGTAAWLWGLLRTRPTRFQLTAATRRRRKPEFEVHFADLAGRDRALRDGIPVTSVPRTLLDLAAAGPPRRLPLALERAEERRLLDLRSLDGLLARRAHHPGAVALRQALDTYRPQPAFTRSNLEKRFLALVTEAGLPAPRMNFVVGRFEVDAFWPQAALAVELDVFETHGSRRSFEEDRERDEELLLRGIATVRVTGRRLDREPATVLRRLGRLLTQRPPPPGATARDSPVLP